MRRSMRRLASFRVANNVLAEITIVSIYLRDIYCAYRASW